MPCQTSINLYLRDCAETGRRPAMHGRPPKKTRPKRGVVVMRAKVIAVSLVVLGACVPRSGAPDRSQARPLTAVCPLEANPAPPTIASAPPRTLVVQVADAGTGSLLAPHRIHITLEDMSGRRRSFATDSTIRLEAVAPGRYALQVITLGYNARVDTVTIAEKSGRTLTVAVHPAPMDACGGFGVVTTGPRKD